MDWAMARTMLVSRGNPDGSSNADVLRPVFNGTALTRRETGKWIIDFGSETPIHAACKFQAPFEYVERIVLPERKKNKRKLYRDRWWLFAETRPTMRRAQAAHPRCLATAYVSKYRLFTWLNTNTVPADGLFIFARSDDYFFGVLHSSIHELWARRMGTQLREAESGFRYTPTTCFETFPLPWPPGGEPTQSPHIHVGGSSQRPQQPPDMNVGARSAPPAVNGGARKEPPAVNGGARSEPPDINVGGRRYERISEAARVLNEQRERWLNPPEWIEPLARAVDAEDDFADVPQPARALIRQSAIAARAAKDARLKKRTLTNLYNERPTWLRLAHEQLDRTVLEAYAAVDPDGAWSPDWAEVWIETGAGQPLPDEHPLAVRRREVDQLVLANLLRMNLARR